MQYVYIPKKSGEPATVGYYAPDGKWQPESDHDTDEQAANRVNFLNGGNQQLHVPLDICAEVPSYTTDPAAAMGVLKKCAHEHKDSICGVSMWEVEGVWYVSRNRMRVKAETLELAIALFAKKFFTK
jgi:hypothetical protein